MEEEYNSVLQIIDDIDCILSGEKTPPEIEITYYTYELLVDGLIVKGKNIQTTAPKILQLIDPNIILPKKISNLPKR